MNIKSVVSSYSVLVGIMGFMPYSAFGALRIGNHSRSYADAYNQVNNMQLASQMQEEQSVVDPELPIAVASQSLAEKILKNDVSAGVQLSDLERCSHIYPDGEFEWARPTGGTGAGGAMGCVAVVGLYTIDRNGDPILLAKAKVAAGDTINCNISSFPEGGYTKDAENVTFPADSAPTHEDVIKVLNAEQKQGALFKIAAGALVGGIGGNAAGKGEAGQSSMFGTGKDKIQTTLVGALGGAAVGAGSAYSGKVAGDMILSTGVNAAAGGVVGNIMASGDAVLRIEKCKLPQGGDSSCVWGYVITSKPLKLSADQLMPNGEVINDKVKNAYFNISDGKTMYVCDQDTEEFNGKNCKQEELVSVQLEAEPGLDIKSAAAKDFDKIRANTENQFSLIKNSDGTISITKGRQLNDEGIFARISNAAMPTEQKPAMISGVEDKTFGVKRSDWNKWVKDHKNVKIWGRSSGGLAYELDTTETTYSVNDFEPMTVNAEDGGIIDISNKARMKSTLTGAGVGGAMGAFVGYQGAQDDIEQRYLAAVQEYKDSLTKFYCQTGKRWLASYNDLGEVPAMRTEEQ